MLLYFHLKDDTPGCTKEACGLRDRMADLKKDVCATHFFKSLICAVFCCVV
jgi:peroxiredoxin